MNTATKACQNCKEDFVIGDADLAFYERIKVPPPTWCPKCRLQRRLAWRNERSLYKRKCDLCGQNIIATYSPDKPFKVYCPDCFYSDKWDPVSYGRDYDFSRPFFLQYAELMRDVPQLALLQINMVNSPWCNYETEDKNCYLNFGGHLNENSAYNQYGLKMKDTFDCYWFQKGEFGYETTLAEDGYKIFESKLCYQCQDTYFSFDCRDCSNIFGCSGLRHKQNYIYNQPVTKEEFAKFIEENVNGSHEQWEELRRKSHSFWKTRPQRAAFIDRSVESRGNLISESKRCESCWLTDKTEDSKNILFTIQVKDSEDTTSVWGGELLYEVMGGMENLNNNQFCAGVIGCTNCQYGFFLANCHDCFGSVNLKKKQYCILNKQYSKEEYEALKAKIIAHMNEMPYVDRVDRVYEYGEFLPLDLSHFAYNETVAYEYFPVKESIGEKMGVAWMRNAGEAHQISDYRISDNIKDAGDIADKVLKCETSGKAYRLIPMELEFYKRFNLPIPRKAPFERHRERLRFIADHLELHPRRCGKCDIAVQSVYTSDEFPIVYCEPCYQAEVA